MKLSIVLACLMLLSVSQTAFAQSSWPLTDPFKSVHITSNTTTTPKTGVGVLHTVCINTKGASSNTATIYDNTAASGTVLGVIDTTSSVGCLTYDAVVAVGITIVTATGTAPDMTASFR